VPGAFVLCVCRLVSARADVRVGSLRDFEWTRNLSVLRLEINSATCYISTTLCAVRGWQRANTAWDDKDGWSLQPGARANTRACSLVALGSIESASTAKLDVSQTGTSQGRSRKRRLSHHAHVHCDVHATFNVIQVRFCMRPDVATFGDIACMVYVDRPHDKIWTAAMAG
jgi:hypothetical protein